MCVSCVVLCFVCVCRVYNIHIDFFCIMYGAIYIYIHMSSRQNPLHLSSCFCYGYRFWGGNPFPGFCGNQHVRDPLEHASSFHCALISFHVPFMFLSFSIHVPFLFLSFSFQCAFMSSHFPFICTFCIHVLSFPF